MSQLRRKYVLYIFYSIWAEGSSLTERKESWYAPLLKSRRSFFTRVFVLFLVIDLLGMVYVTRSVYGNLTDGYEWPSPGNVLFPFPFHYPSMFPVTQPLNPLETFTYLIFISNSVWIFWVSLATIYIILPLILKIKDRKSNL